MRKILSWERIVLPKVIHIGGRAGDNFTALLECRMVCEVGKGYNEGTMRIIAAAFSLVFIVSGCSNGSSEIGVTTPIAPPPPPPYGKPEILAPTHSLAVPRYSGKEKRPVTLKPEVRITKTQLMKNVDRKTLLIVVRNKSGHLLSESTQFYLSSADYKRGGYYGKGPLFPGEMRIIKAHDIAPAKVMLLWHRRGIVKRGTTQGSKYTGGKWKSEHLVQSGPPLVLTILPEDKIKVSRDIKDVTGR